MSHTPAETEVPEAPPSRPGLRLGIAVLSLAAVATLAAGQAALVLAAPPAGDAAGRGMEQGLRAMAAWAGVPLELGLVGLAVGVMVPSGVARLLAWPAGLGAAAAWGGTAAVVVGLASLPDLAAVPYAQELVGACWLVGFLGFGLALGASRQVGSVLATLVPLPLSVLAPVAFFVTSA